MRHITEYKYERRHKRKSETVPKAESGYGCTLLLREFREIKPNGLGQHGYPDRDKVASAGNTTLLLTMERRLGVLAAYHLDVSTKIVSGQKPRSALLV